MVLSGSTGKSTRHMVPSGPGSLCRGGGDSPYNTCIILLLDKRVGSFQSPDRLSRDLTNGLTSLSTDGVAKEGRPKFNPRPGPRPDINYIALYYVGDNCFILMSQSIAVSMVQIAVVCITL